MWIFVVIAVAGLLVGVLISLLINLKSQSDGCDKLYAKIDDMANEVLRRKHTKHENGEVAHRVREMELEFVLELLANLKNK